MPNGARLAALFACALALVETGRQLAGKQSLNRFGEVLLAGGMAFFYYCTFAAHHVERLKVIDSPVLAGVLLLAAAGAIAAVSWLRNTQATAILGIVLASYSTMLQPIGWMSCVSSILLGAVGLFFMLRPGWTGPGWASMLGSYGAFLGWQLLGASGEEVRLLDPAVLWFLPPVWAMFVVPSIVSRFRESLSERARAWFTAANNGLFLALFSLVWIYQNGQGDYWKVAAVFGSVLIALGILGRRQNATAGGVNIGQGLAVATFALILRLDGYHLALVLGIESLMLALAALKYRGKSESAFSLLCGLGAAGLIIADNPLLRYITGKNEMPVWSTAITAALVAAASFITIRMPGRDDSFGRFIRVSAGFLFAAAVLVATHLCLFRLGDPWGLITAMVLSGALSLGALKLDRKRLMPELPWASLWFLGCGIFLGFRDGSTMALGIAVAVSLAATWLWHRQEGIEGSPDDLVANPGVPAYAFSFSVPVFLWLVCGKTDGTNTLALNQIAALLLVPASLLLRSRRLAQAAGLYSLYALFLLLTPPAEGTWIIFASSGLATVAATLLVWRKEADEVRPGASSIFRLSAFISYCTAWHQFAPGAWTDFLAITSIILTAVSVVMKRKMFVECLGLIGIALVGLIFEMSTTPWVRFEGAGTWRGISVVIALLALVMTYRQRPALIGNPAKRKAAISALAGLTCLITTIWATQMLVWRFGWKPSAVLWTVLGFAFVSTGLWQRLYILRVCGFMLLAISLLKLFAVDVWDFSTFMRVVSFIVLGAALIMLGLFYNRFADAIKALLDDERGAKE